MVFNRLKQKYVDKISDWNNNQHLGVPNFLTRKKEK